MITLIHGDCIGIEMEEEYIKIAEARCEHASLHQKEKPIPNTEKTSKKRPTVSWWDD